MSSAPQPIAQRFERQNQMSLFDEVRGLKAELKRVT